MTVRQTLSDAATAILVLCAIVVTGIAAWRQFEHSPEVRSGKLAGGQAVPHWREIAADGSLIGSKTAPVVVVEFSDFQCPFCGRVEPVLAEIAAKYPGRMAVAYLHYPLTQLHPQAETAAIASECAREEGRFVEYHHFLFAHQDSLGRIPWDVIASRTGVTKLSAFRQCLASDDAKSVVRRQAAIAIRLKVAGTPAFVLDGRLYLGLNPDSLRAKIVQLVLQAAAN